MEIGHADEENGGKSWLPSSVNLYADELSRTWEMVMCERPKK